MAVLDKLRQNTARLQEEHKALAESGAAESKSSAGDKHEVGKAMVQGELDRLALKLHQAKRLLAEAEQLSESRQQRAVTGSLVQTSLGWFYLGVAAAKVSVAGKDVMCISMQSPMAKCLFEAEAGQSLSFRGNDIQVIKVS